MAFIVKNFMTRFGVNLPEAYIRVSNPIITEIHGVVRDANGNNVKQYPLIYNMDVYVDNNARVNGLTPIESMSEKFMYDINSKSNIYVQCYAHSRLLPYCVNAEDC